jgi:hypothetical protein
MRGSRSSSEFVAVLEKTVTCMDRMLGYRGQDRFVIFYHEPRAQEVLWRDSHSYGFATGAWSTFMDDVAPVADHYHVNVGCQATPATHVLLIDRSDRKAYFAARSEAMQFLALVARDKNAADGGLALHAKVPAAMVEITHVEITKLAHQIWERKGRPVGQDLQVWLEAEAELKASMKAVAH